MGRRGRPSVQLVLDEQQRAELERRVRAGTSAQRDVVRARIILAFWVNQVELFFSILQRQCLRRGSFRSTAELRTAVVAFVAAWNRERAHPFRWTFTGYPLQAGSDRPAVEAA